MANFNLLVQRSTDRVRSRFTLLFIFACLIALLAPTGAAGADANPPGVPDTYSLVGDNDLFQLYVDSTTLAFKVIDKRSNYVWNSGLDEIIEGDRLNNSWQAFAKSGLSIEYLDNRAINRRISIANADHTLDVTPIDQGVSAQVTFLEFGISVGVRLELEADGVRVEIPFETIHEEDTNFRLGRVYMYPFLGAARGSTISGYMMVPDGIGSLIRFGDTTRAQNMFYGRYYGEDLGMIAKMPYDFNLTNPMPISMPVFGIAHESEQSAFVSVVEQGAAYGEVQVHPAGIITNFNFLYNAFIYNQTYFQATNRSGAGVTTVQNRSNEFNAVVHYRFLSGTDANYVGMARSYQQFLVNNGILHRVDFPQTNIGIRLEFLGGDKERILFWNRFIAMTTLPQMSEILTGLQISNPEVIYYGWQPYGATSMPPSSLSLDGSLGSLSDLRSVIDQVDAIGGHFSLYYDPQVALWQEPGYSPRNDLAMSITNVNLEGYNRYYQSYFTLNTLQQRFTELSSDVAAQTGAGLALDSIGSTLYSDFRDRQIFNRESSREAYQTLLADASVRLGLYRPNDYLFNVTQAYYDMPLGNNGYVYTSEAVPFLPIVLAGYIPYYGTAINFSSSEQEDLLRLVEYGMSPSYFLTYEPTATMLNTPSNWIYTSSYAQWGDQIRNTYAWMNALLAPVLGQEIVAHEALAEGVYATTYANGQQIIVNYNDQPFVQNGVTVGAKDAALLENGL
ncbi:MAG: DUF5696 domain-containing protein [Anaerolineae bacterium]